jgi:hypothetical protein
VIRILIITKAVKSAGNVFREFVGWLDFKNTKKDRFEPEKELPSFFC